MLLELGPLFGSTPCFYVSPVVESHHSGSVVRSGLARIVFSWGEKQRLTKQTSYLCPPGVADGPGLLAQLSALCAFSRYLGHSQEGYSKKMT